MFCIFVSFLPLFFIPFLRTHFPSNFSTHIKYQFTYLSYLFPIRQFLFKFFICKKSNADVHQVSILQFQPIHSSPCMQQEFMKICVESHLFQFWKVSIFSCYKTPKISVYLVSEGSAPMTKTTRGKEDSDTPFT